MLIRQVGAAALLSAVVGCGGPGTPRAAAKHSSVPPQAVNDASLGVIRIRFNASGQGAADPQRRALDAWMEKHGLPCPKLSYLLDQLAKAKYDTLLAVIPGDAAVLEDAGVYVGGPPDKPIEDLEDVLIKVGGFSLGGVAAGSLQVIPIGNGWYFVGINGDGIIEGASDAAADRMGEALDRIGDMPACAAVPIEGLDDAVADLASGHQSRLIRRIRAVAEALEEAIALAIDIGQDARFEAIIAFPTEKAAAGLDKAFERIRKDMELALQGSIEQKEITPEEADRDRRLIAALRCKQRGHSVILYEEISP
jgi:hypothetical protein